MCDDVSWGEKSDIVKAYAQVMHAIAHNYNCHV